MWNLFKRKKKTEYENSELYAIPVYNAINNLIILVKFTDRYLYDAYQFISTCTNIDDLTVKTIDKEIAAPTSDDLDEEAERKNISNTKIEAYTPEEVPEQIHYIILAGGDDVYNEIFNYIEYATNPILQIILEGAIYKCRSAMSYETQIDRGLMRAPSFKYYDNTRIKFDETKFSNGLFYAISDANKFIDKLPKMSKRDIIDICRCSTGTIEDVSFTYAIKLILLKSATYPMSDIVNAVSAAIPGEWDIDLIKHLVNSPIFLIEDDDYLIGNATDDEIDDLFKQNYDTFTGLIDEVQEYKSIDEVVGEIETEGDTVDDDYVRNHTKRGDEP